MAKWTAADIPSQAGKLALITGSNSGIGFEDVRVLAERGASVVMACRDSNRAEEARKRILAAQNKAEIVVMPLDLADLDSVRSFAREFSDRFDRLDLLINNAGVMMCPASTTKQGFEMQFGVNHLGHFALTGLLLDRLRAAPGSRVINVSSQAHRGGKIVFDDIDFQRRRYDRMLAYNQSKLANLLFTFEAVRRFAGANIDVLVAAAHPGWTRTNLQKNWRFAEFLNPLFGMPTSKGALPTLRAATDPDVRPGDYFGPRGLYEMWGYPKRVGTIKRAKDEAVAAQLWELSELRTGVRYPSTRAIAAHE